MVRCRFEPWGKEVDVKAGTTVLAAARLCAVPLEAACGGLRFCGTCAVRVLEGELDDPDKDEAAYVGGKPFRLACRARVIEDVVVHPLVGEASREPKELLPDEDDLPRKPALGSEDREFIAAFDVGTTTIKLALAGASLPEVCRIERHNTQALWGADVISRMAAALDTRAQAETLRDFAQNTMLEMLSEALASCHGVLSDVNKIVIAGNTIMVALLAGADMGDYATPPYGSIEPITLNEGPLVDAMRAQAPLSTILVVDSLGKLVGGDIAAGLHGIAQTRAEQPYLFVDIGTNIECALVKENKVYVASAPAGSAFNFEGQRGSDTLECLAELLRAQIMLPSGLLDETHPEVSRNSEGILCARGITQQEIRSLQLIKAAFSVSIDAVLREADIEPRVLSSIYLGGAFGQQVSSGTLFDVGILASGYRCVPLVYLPDAALEGALLLARKSSDYCTESAVNTCVRSIAALNNQEIIALDFVSQETFKKELFGALDFPQ